MGRTELSSKELSRAEVMARVKAGNLRLGEASELLELSYRQAKRIWARYRGGGAKALQHGNTVLGYRPQILARLDINPHHVRSIQLATSGNYLSATRLLQDSMHYPRTCCTTLPPRNARVGTIPRYEQWNVPHTGINATLR